MDQIFAYFENHAESLLSDLFRLLRQPSISGTGEGIRPCAEMTRELLEDVGIPARLVETGGHPLVFGTYDEGAPRTLLVYGHYDVMPAGNPDAWHTPPFEPVIRQNTIFCRGVADNKGQFFAHIAAVRALRDLKGQVGCNLRIVLEGEEEIGSPHLGEFFEHHRHELAADGAFTADALQHANGQPFILPGLKGGLTLELTCPGPRVPCHGAMADIVPNPLWRLLHALGELRSSDGTVRVPGFLDAVRPLSPRERELLEAAPNPIAEVRDLVGLPRLLPEAEEHFHIARTRPTFNLSYIGDGEPGVGPRPTLPTEARAFLRINLVPDQDPRDIEKKVRQALDRGGYGDVRIAVRNATPPSYTDVDHPYIKFVTAIARQAFRREPLIYPRVIGSGPDHYFTKMLGLPSVWVPYAGAFSETHAPNENMTLTAIFEGMRHSALLFESMGCFSPERGGTPS